MRLLGRLAVRLGGALFARGRFVPAVTRVEAGREVVVSPEIVEPQGVLRSTTVLAALGTAITTGVALYAQIKAGIPDDTAFQATCAAFLGALAAIWRHIRSWMPVRGAATPTPRL